MIRKKDIRARMLAFAPLTSYVGDRISPRTAGQKTAYPYVTFFRVDETEAYGLLGSQGTSKAIYQFDVFSKVDEQADRITEEIVNCFAKDFRRGWLNGTNSVFVLRCRASGIGDEYGEPIAAAGTGEYQSVIQIRFDYNTP